MDNYNTYIHYNNYINPPHGGPRGGPHGPHGGPQGTTVLNQSAAGANGNYEYNITRQQLYNPNNPYQPPTNSLPPPPQVTDGISVLREFRENLR